jgi:hypothetical protein
MTAGQATRIPEDSLREIASQGNSSSMNDQRQLPHLLVKATKIDTREQDESRRSVHNTTKQSLIATATYRGMTHTHYW